MKDTMEMKSLDYNNTFCKYTWTRTVHSNFRGSSLSPTELTPIVIQQLSEISNWIVGKILPRTVFLSIWFTNIAVRSTGSLVRRRSTECQLCRNNITKFSRNDKWSLWNSTQYKTNEPWNLIHNMYQFPRFNSFYIEYYYDCILWLLSNLLST